MIIAQVDRFGTPVYFAGEVGKKPQRSKIAAANVDMHGLCNWEGIVRQQDKTVSPEQESAEKAFCSQPRTVRISRVTSSFESTLPKETTLPSTTSAGVDITP